MDSDLSDSQKMDQFRFTTDFSFSPLTSMNTHHRVFFACLSVVDIEWMLQLQN